MYFVMYFTFNIKGGCILHEAIKKGSLEIMEFILKRYPDMINIKLHKVL